MKLFKILVVGCRDSKFDNIFHNEDFDFELFFSESKPKDTINVINEINPDLIIIELDYPAPFKGIRTIEKITGKINLPQIIISDTLDFKKIKKAKKVNPSGLIDYAFLCNPLFPVYIDFAINKHKRDNLVINERKTETQTIQELLKEIQSSRIIINENAKELIALSSKFTDFQEKSKELIRNKDKFFSIIAHDMKGPLQGLIGYTEILSNDCNNLSRDEIREISVDLHTSAKLLLELLEDFLHWSRIQRGAIDSDPSVQNLNQIVKLNFDLLSLQANQKEIKLVNNIPLEQKVFADLNMVNTIIRNLISNAIKFTNVQGKIEINAIEAGNGYVVVSVSDNGIGMSKEDVNKLFRIDIQHTTVGTANEKGTGLGLVLCKELIEKNHGKIHVESEIDKGTKFVFTLPSNKESFYSIRDK